MAITWTERQPAGASDKRYQQTASDADGSNLIVGMQNSRLYTSDDYGVTWIERQPAGVVNKNWFAVDSDSDGSNLIVAANNGRLYTSDDSGATWTERKPAGDSDVGWYGVASDADGSNLIAGITGGRLYTSDDYGVTWTERRPKGDLDGNWRNLASDSDGSHLVAGEGSGRLYTSDDSGATWTERQPAGASDKNWQSIASDADGSNLIVGANGGRLYTSDDYGVTWTERQPAGASNKNWTGADSDSDGSHLIVVVSGGRLYTSDDYGVTWTDRQPTGDSDEAWSDAACDSDGDRFMAGIYNGRLYTGIGFYFQTSGPDIAAIKKLVAAGNNEIWYESSAGTMIELSAANGDIDTTDQLAMFEAYQKVFIVNGANLKIADFINTKITVTALTDNRCPAKGDILTQDNGSGNIAYMVVDFINTARTNIYGYAYYEGTTTEFVTTVDISSNDATGNLDPNPIPNANISAITAAPHWYDWTAYPDITLIVGGTIKSYGSLPNKVYLGCNYRGRCITSGNPEFPFQWYMTRQTHPWDFAYVANDAGSPVKGGNSDAGEIGDIVRALIPYKDDFLIFGCASTMWFLAGDPTFGGSINELDLTVGIFGSQSWCFDEQGSLYFWGTNGIYVTQIPGVPDCITEIKLPDLIKDEAADPSTHKITMVYARVRKGILICITKLSDGTNSNYWYDLRTGGFFPESYPNECGVYSAFYYAANSTTYKDLLIGCRDGYIRKFDSSAKDDDKGASDQAINSYVKFGPIPMSQDPDKLGKLSGLNLVTAGGGAGGSQSDSDNVNFKVYVENSAEKVIEKLSANTNPNMAGTFKAPGRQPGARRKQKVKGAYVGIRLDNTASTETWGFEKLTGTILPAGRNR